MHKTRRATLEAGPARDAVPDPQRRPWSLLILLSVAEFMVILDATVVNVALPSIGRALHVAAGDLQWVVTAYVLLSGGLVLLGGRAADVAGRRRMFLAGLAVFTAASLASGLAPAAGVLFAARASQGLGAALLTPAALSIITTTYSGAQRAAALSAWGAIGGAGAAAGVLAGGILTTWLGWRSVFLVNVPVGLAAGVLSLHLVPRSGPSARVGSVSRPLAGAPSGTAFPRRSFLAPQSRRRRAPAAPRELDLPGAVLATAGLVTGVYALAGTRAHGWGSARTLLLLAVSAGLLAAFAAAERSARRPLLPPGTWRNRSLVAGMVVMLGATGILVGTFFLNSLYLQDVRHASALRAGLEFLPVTVVIGLGAHIASRLLPRAGTRVLAAAGLALMGAGALLLSGMSAGAGYLAGLLPGLLVIGAGTGLVFPAVSVTAMSDVAADRAGLASGLMTTAHEIGAAIGVAVFSVVAIAARGGFAVGYRHGFTVVAGIAAGLALLALAVVPAVRPAEGTRVAVH